MSDFREATECINIDHLTLLAQRIARGIQHLEVSNIDKMTGDGRWLIAENFIPTIINNATQLLHLDIHNFSGDAEDI